MAKKDNTKMPKKENQIDKVAGVVSKYKGLLITIICVAVVGLIGYAVYEKVSTSVKDKYLSEIVRLPVYIADEPLLAVAKGTGKALEEISLLQQLTNEE